MRELIGKSKTDREKDDFYTTPPEEIRNILNYEKLEGNVLENSCGNGIISEAVKELYPDIEVISTDLVDRGYGETGLDFLSEDYPHKEVDNVVMNPPFKLLEGFMRKSTEIAKRKVIMLGRIQALESIKRYSFFQECPPSRVYVYANRIGCKKNGEGKAANSMMYAWYVWDRADKSMETKLHWIKRIDAK